MLLLNLEAVLLVAINEGIFDYSSSYGGLLCQKDWHLDVHRYHATPRAIHFLRAFFQELI